MGSPDRDRMGRGSRALGDVTRMVETGVPGARVVIPFDAAPFTFRWPESAFESLSVKGQQLGITVVGDGVVVELSEGERSRKTEYQLLYGLIEAAAQGRGERYLETLPPGLKSLLERDTPVREHVETLAAGVSGMPDEDLLIPMVYLFGLYQSLRNQSGLNSPEVLLTAATR
jgi:hypothetical protein